MSANVKTANVKTWIKDVDGEWVLVDVGGVGGACASIWPDKGGWRAAYWGDGRMRELEEKFTSKKAAQVAVEAL